MDSDKSGADQPTSSEYVRALEADQAWNEFLEEVDAEMDQEFVPAHGATPVATFDMKILGRIDDALAAYQKVTDEATVLRDFLTEEQNIRLYGATTPQDDPRVGDVVRLAGDDGIWQVTKLGVWTQMKALHATTGKDTRASDPENLTIERREVESLTPGEKEVLAMDGNVRMVRSVHMLERGHTYTILAQPVDVSSGYPQIVGTPRAVRAEITDRNVFAGFDGFAGRTVFDIVTEDGVRATCALPKPVGLDTSLNIFAVEHRSDALPPLREIPLGSLRPGDVVASNILDSSGEVLVPAGSFMTVNASFNKHMVMWDGSSPEFAQLRTVMVNPENFVQGREVTNAQLYKAGVDLSEQTVADLRVGDKVSVAQLRDGGLTKDNVVITFISHDDATCTVKYQDVLEYGAPAESVTVALDRPIEIHSRRESALTDHEMRMVHHRVLVHEAKFAPEGMANSAVWGTVEGDTMPSSVTGTLVSVSKDASCAVMRGKDGKEVSVALADERIVRYRSSEIPPLPDRSGGLATQYMKTYMRYRNTPARATNIEASMVSQVPSVHPMRIA